MNCHTHMFYLLKPKATYGFKNERQNFNQGTG